MTMHSMMLALGLALVAVPLGVAAAEQDEAKKTTTVARRSGAPTFTPTNVGTPSTRLGGATRGHGENVVRTEALVPEEAGHTLRERPVLYWYLSDETDHRIDFALIGVDPINPIIETTLPKGLKPGIQRIVLADLDVRLESGISYQWFVRVIPNPDQRLYDRVIGGGIERVEASPDMEQRLAAAHPEDAYYVLAEAGIWYDALDALNVLIVGAPDNADLQSQRAALFAQVGLDETLK